MIMGVEIESINFLDIEQKLANLADDETMLQIHNLYAKFLDPYVPMREGTLAHNVTITPNYIQYNSPYAHYMYTGVVYGPNFPIDENGKINFSEGAAVEWRSPKDQKKHPTGKPIKYFTEMHQKATHHWDKAAMDDKGDVFKADVKTILQKKLREGNNG